MSHKSLTDRGRWLAFTVLCFGDLMNVVDATIVNVALPTIRTSLGFTETGLVWVVNAYLLTFGGFLLLGGRLADLYGQRRLFLAGVALFTVASIACGLATSQTLLIVARGVQGVGGAVLSAVALSLIMSLFPEGPGRVRAMGLFGFVMAGGGSLGATLGGVLTALFDWRSVFLVNIPIGILVFVFALRLLPRGEGVAHGRRLDLAGAATITASLLLAVYAVINAEQAGWASAATLGQLAVALALMGLFVAIEARVREPLAPLGLFRLRNLSVANAAAGLWAAAMFAWFFLAALYMQQVLGYGPLAVGLAFLPANLIMGAFSYSLSARLVNRYGVRRPLVWGLALAALGLALFGFAPEDGTFVVHILPAMVLSGVGAGMAFNPLMLAAMNDVPEDQSGLASGVVNTSFMMGGSLGLAVLASLASARTNQLLGAGQASPAALTGGYQLAFLAGAACAGVAALMAGGLLRPRPITPGRGH